VEEFLAVKALVIVLVLVATLVAMAVRRIRLPYTVSLVLVGLFISVQRPVAIEVTPELILSIFVPPLVFEAAFHLDFRLVRSNLGPIIILAMPGVVLTTLFVRGMVALGTGLPFGVAAVFGALIAATDPVAVVALFRALGVSRQLATAVEGESLFNDGTAIVIFNIALVAALTGAFDPLAGLFDFLRVVLGGMTVGLALGWLAAQLMARVDDRLVVTTLTTLLAYGAYLVAERFHVSGVLAVVMAGLVSGNVGLAGAPPTTKIMLFNLWDYLGFLANSLVFLLIGLDVDLSQVVGQLGADCGGGGGGAGQPGRRRVRSAVDRSPARKAAPPSCEMATRLVLGRLAWRDQPGPGPQPAGRPARTGSAGVYDLRCGAVHAAMSGNDDLVLVGPTGADETASAPGCARETPGAVVRCPGRSEATGTSAPRRVAAR